MDINTAISQVAAKDPQIYALVAKQGMESSVLSALTGTNSDSSTSSGLLGGSSGQEPTDEQLLQSIESSIGQNIDTTA